jgi:hypothetical protein
MLWPDSTETQARANLRNLVHGLQHGLPHVGKRLEMGTGTLGWRPDATVEVDVADFEAAVNAADTARRSADTFGRVRRLCDVAVPHVHDGYLRRVPAQLRRPRSLHACISARRLGHCAARFGDSDAREGAVRSHWSRYRPSGSPRQAWARHAGHRPLPADAYWQRWVCRWRPLAIGCSVVARPLFSSAQS